MIGLIAIGLMVTTAAIVGLEAMVCSGQEPGGREKQVPLSGHPYIIFEGYQKHRSYINELDTFFT